MAKRLATIPDSSPSDDVQAYRIKDFCRRYSMGRTTVFALIAEGKLATIKIRGMRLIPRDSATALFAREASK